MTSYHDAQRQKGFILQKTRRVVTQFIEFCSKSKQASENINQSLEQFIKQDQLIKEQYERTNAFSDNSK